MIPHNGTGCNANAVYMFGMTTRDLKPYQVSQQLLENQRFREALRARDFQTAFALMRKYDGVSQERIASVVDGLTQGRVSRIMGGHDRLASLDLIERLADGLRVPGELLGLAARSWENSDLTELVVEAEYAELRYDGRYFHIVVRRTLHNVGTDPVTRYLIRIAVDRHPEDPERSNKLYREDPLTFDELQLEARCGRDRMTWKVKQDRDSVKELWLNFGNESARFPLYPNQRKTIEYSYRVTEAKWGHWFQRAIRIPTRYMSVRIALPVEFDPSVWGTETSTTADTVPLRDEINVEEEGRMRIFRWSISNPKLNVRYRFEWASRQKDEIGRPSDRMADIGVEQRGSAVLHRKAEPFELPADSDTASQVLVKLNEALDRIQRTHTFSKGAGIAAPQLGIGKAAAIVRLAGGETITLLNPRVIEETGEVDERYEGCLSFFDVRGLVVRPREIHVEHTSLAGKRHLTVFRDGVARLVGHEIDHLEGRLYTDRMAAGVEVIPVEEYRGTGSAWTYDDPR